MPQEPKSRTWHRDAETDRRLWLVLVTQLGPGTTFSTDYAWQLYLAGTRGALRRARRGEIQASLDRHVTTGRLVPKIDDSGQWAYEINEEWWKEHMTWSS